MEANEATATDQEVSMRLVTGFWLSRAVWLAERLRLADVIGDGPASPAEVAQASGADPDAVERLLQALAAAGVFQLDGEGCYVPTPASDLLRSDNPSSQRGLIEFLLGGESFERPGGLWRHRCGPDRPPSMSTTARRGLWRARRGRRRHHRGRSGR